MAENPSPGRFPLSPRRRLLLLLLFSLVLLGSGIGLRDPWPSDEPRFALVAQQMVTSGDWLFPHRGSELYSDKPPLMFWLQAASYEVVRDWRVAFMLPSLLSGLLVLVLVWDLGRRWWNPRVGLYAAGALLFTFQFTFQFKRAQIDPVVVAWITLANWGLLRHFVRGPDWRAFWLGCGAAGLGVITKGVGVIAFLMFVPYLALRWGGGGDLTRTQGAKLRWLAGLACFLLPIALWLVPMLLVAHARGTPAYSGYVQDLLFRQTAQRYADSWNHAQSFWYYLPIVLFSWLPLSLAYPGLVPRWWRALRARDARIVLPLAWVLLVIVFFSLPRGKRDVYILPALPMLALASAPYLEELTRTLWLRASAFVLAAASGGLLVGVAASALFAGGRLQHAAQRLLPQADAVEWMIVLAIGGGLLLGALVFRVRHGVQGLLAGLLGMWLVWSFAAWPLMNGERSARDVMQRAGQLVGPEAEIGMVAWKEQNLLMADRPMRDFGFKKPWPEQFAAAVQWQAGDPAHRWIFALDQAMGECVERARAIEVGHANRRDWWLFRADAVVPGCTPGGGEDEGEP
ncbi:ArnT family glycosyltransferase [Dokdonella sp.]|uniref:ArnT family glycosyltransferase n=1 Tax=Dokdonella sp. TaxID=2291710 RepID=UPI0031BFE363|nr:glycosyltransferase family 39 protein [Dokdonella sp.]